MDEFFARGTARAQLARFEAPIVPDSHQHNEHYAVLTALGVLMVETITEACVGREREELATIVSGMKRLLESKLEGFLYSNIAKDPGWAERA